MHLGRTDEQRVGERRVPRSERNSGEHAALERPLVATARIRQAYHELVEERRRKHQLRPGSLTQPAERVASLAGVAVGQLAKAAPSGERQEHGGGERAETLVRTDVRGRTLATDVLLASGERQHVAPPPLLVHGLADEPARHAAHVALARGEEPQIRTPEGKRDAEALAFSHRDVDAERARRMQDPEAHRLRRHADEQRVGGSNVLGDCRQIFDDAEEVRIADDDSRGWR